MTLTNSSKRELAIDGGTVRFLAEWKEMQSSEFCQGGEVPGDFPVCSSEGGDFLEPAYFSKWFRRFMVECGLARFERIDESKDRNGVKRYRCTGYAGPTMHSLRHTQATLLIGKGLDIKTVQNRMGHSTAAVTMDIYAHAIGEKEREVAEAMSGILGGTEGAEANRPLG